MQKRILILGGANLHCKMVKAAMEMGLYTVVTDYLDECDSPAKQIASKSYKIDVNDTDGVVKMCQEEHIDAVLSTHLDACQRAYFNVASRLGLPCYITSRDQVFTLTNKAAFKRYCRAHGVDVIREYSLDQIQKDSDVEYPVLVKPSYSRGSRGQTLCATREEVLAALKVADAESFDGGVVIEQYIENAGDVGLSYFFVDGEAHLLHIATRNPGSKEYNLERISKASISPSVYLQEYVDAADSKMTRMLKDLGIKNGPVFLQALIKGGKVYFHDCGFRFAGTEYTTMFNDVFKIDIHKMMIEFSLNGCISQTYGVIPKDAAKLNGKVSLRLFPLLKAGRIQRIEGLDQLSSMSEVLCYTVRCNEKEQVLPVGDIRQRLAEIAILTDDMEGMRAIVNTIQSKLHVISDEGEEMICDKLEL